METPRDAPSGYSPPRNPHKIYLLTICALGGFIALLLPGRFSDSLSHYLPPWAFTSWAVSLSVSGGIALYGALTSGYHGATLERLGLTILTGVCLVWAISIGGFFPDKGLGTVLFYIGFALANAARIRILTADLRLAREQMEEARKLREASNDE